MKIEEECKKLFLEVVSYFPKVEENIEIFIFGNNNK
jgi:hypothetical protein